MNKKEKTALALTLDRYVGMERHSFGIEGRECGWTGVDALLRFAKDAGVQLEERHKDLHKD